LDGERHFLALFAARFLMRRRRSEGGVEGDVARILAGRPRLDVAAAFALGMRTRTPPAVAAGDLV